MSTPTPTRVDAFADTPLTPRVPSGAQPVIAASEPATVTAPGAHAAVPDPQSAPPAFGGRPSSAAPLTSERDRDVLRSFARRIDPSDAGAHNNLGVLYFNKGLLGEAV